MAWSSRASTVPNSGRTILWGDTERSGLSQTFRGTIDVPEAPASGPESDESRRKRILEELRIRRLRGGHRAEEGDDIVPASAYASSCPVEAAPCCECSAREIPCGKYYACQSLCGNPTDMHTRLAGRRGAGGTANAAGEEAQEVMEMEQELEGNEAGGFQNKTVKPGVRIGIPHYQDSGWTETGDGYPAGFSNLRDLQEQEYRLMSLEVFGLTPVHNTDEPPARSRGLQLIIPKRDVHGTCKEVKKLIQKILDLQVPVVVQLHAAFEDDDQLYFIYEDCVGSGMLPMHIARGHRVSETDGVMFIQQIAAAVDAATTRKLFLLDWSPWNCFSTSFNSLCPVKLFGVGLAGILYEETLAVRYPFASALRKAFLVASPEVYAERKKKPATAFNAVLQSDTRIQSEVYSLLAIAFMALAGRSPFLAGTPDEVRELQLHGVVFDTGTDFAGVNPAGVSLIEAGLSKQAKDRPSLQKLLSSPWITTLVAQSGVSDVSDVIDSLVYYASNVKVLRAVGEIMQYSLGDVRERMIKERFNVIDVKGDGTVSCAELTCSAVQSRDLINQAFLNLYGSKDKELRFDDFFFANMFSEEILSEQMLRECFNNADPEGQGVISGAMLFETLCSVFPDLKPTHFKAFFLRGKQDWDTPITFEGFCKYFPKCRERAEIHVHRKEHANDQLDLLWEAWIGFRKATNKFIPKLEKFLSSLERSCERNITNPDRRKGTEKELNRTRELIDQALKLLVPAELPRLHVPDRGYKLFKTDRRTVKETLGDPPINKVDLRSFHDFNDDIEQKLMHMCKDWQQHRTAADHARPGIFALDSFIMSHFKEWEVMWFREKRRLLEIENVKSAVERNQMLTELHQRLIKLVKGIVKDLRELVKEQQALAEAARAQEEAMPPRPWSRAGPTPARPGLGPPKEELAEYRFMQQEITKAKRSGKGAQRNTESDWLTISSLSVTSPRGSSPSNSPMRTRFSSSQSERSKVESPGFCMSACSAATSSSDRVLPISLSDRFTSVCSAR